jgi:hypothetical protein
MQNKVETLGHLFGSLRKLAAAAGVAPASVTNERYGWRDQGEVPRQYNGAILRYAVEHAPADGRDEWLMQVRACLQENVCSECGRPFDVTVTG